MNKKAEIKIFFGIIIICIISFPILFIYLIFHEIGSDFSDLGECGFSLGPCHGEKVILNSDSLMLDVELEIPEGSIAFMNVQDTLAPIILKMNKEDSVLWSIRLTTGSDSCWIPLYKMSDLYIRHRTIYFFNESYAEPGIIYLTENYDFEMMCLSPM